MTGTGPRFNKVSVLVPVVEECDDLLEVHREAVREIQKLGVDYEFVYLLNIGEPRVIADLQELHSGEFDHVRVVQLGHSLGNAALLSAGIEMTDGDVIITMSPSFEVDLSCLPALYASIERGTDLALARREPEPSGPASRRQSRLFNRLISWAAGTHFSDIASETRALRRSVAEEIPLYGDFHRYLPILAERTGYRVEEIATRQHPRSVTPSIYSASTYLWRAMDVLSIFFLSRFTRHPLRLFGGVGGVFAAVGGVILLIVALQRVVLGTALADRPILVLSALLFGLGVQMFSIGLLGELILFFHARNVRDYRIAEIYQGATRSRLQEDGSEPTT